MAVTYSTLRIDRETRDRLAALSNHVGQPITQVVALLSHATFTDLLHFSAAMGRAEARAAERGNE